MNPKGRQHQIRRLPPILLICFLATLNVSQGMVFCVGAAGHVAIEPLGHRHCDVAIHDHEHDVDAQSSREYDHSYTASEDCHPCVDIPLTLGPLEKRSLSDLPPDAASPVIGEPSTASRNLGTPAPASEGLFLPPDQTALRSIVIQV
ncbi:MAG: hypothetical protein GXY19_09065 [Phycisphaerae bacterium]|nr:hypothetical protein [Phycisphaerae bacterium]